MQKKSHVLIILLSITLCTTITGCGARKSTTKGVVTSADMYKGPGGLEKRFNESKTFNAPYKACFRSILEVIQNKGFIIENADIESGFIKARTTDSLLGDQGLDQYLPPLPNIATTWVIYAGITNRQLSMTIEPITEQKTRLRVSSVRYLYAIGPYTGIGGTYPEYDSSFLNELASDIESELMTRKNLRK